MTVQTPNQRIQYIADGIQDTFPYDFVIFDEDHLDVYEEDLIVTAYTVTGVGVQTGGDVIFTTPPADQVIITIWRNVPHTQLTDYLPFDAFPSETHERALDLLVQQIQQHHEIFNRTPQQQITDVVFNLFYDFAASRADTMLGFIDDGSFGYAQLTPDQLTDFFNEFKNEIGPYDLGFSFLETPIIGVTIDGYLFTRAVDYAIDFAGSAAEIVTAGTVDDFVLEVLKNTVQVATITFAPGSFTGVFDTSGVPLEFRSGDTVAIRTVSGGGATVSGLTITLSGTRIAL